jgi:hypothetical protein
MSYEILMIQKDLIMLKRCVTAILLVFALIGHNPIAAQDYSIPKLQASIAYFGELITHPGVKLGINYTLKQKSKIKKSGKQINKSWITGAHATFYRHKFNHKALIFNGFIGRQRIGYAGFLMQLNFETGYMASFLDGEAYEWNGSTLQRAKKGSSHFVFGFNGGIGWDFGKRTSLPVTFAILPHLYIQAPYNTQCLPRAALVIQATYKIK